MKPQSLWRSMKGVNRVPGNPSHRHAWPRVPSCMLAKVSRGTSSLVETPPRRSANLMVTCVVGSPRLHPSSRGFAAFLSESISRATITGRSLGRGSDPAVSGKKANPDVRDVSTVRTEKFLVKRRRKRILVSPTCQGVVGLQAIEV